MGRWLKIDIVKRPMTATPFHFDMLKGVVDPLNYSDLVSNNGVVNSSFTHIIERDFGVSPSDQYNISKWMVDIMKQRAGALKTEGMDRQKIADEGTGKVYVADLALSAREKAPHQLYVNGAVRALLPGTRSGYRSGQNGILLSGLFHGALVSVFARRKMFSVRRSRPLSFIHCVQSVTPRCNIRVTITLSSTGT